MKKSTLLLVAAVGVLFMGMTASNLLLKQAAEKIDWKNPYRNTTEMPLPNARYLVIHGAPDTRIIIRQGNAKAYVDKTVAKRFRTKQQADTLYVSVQDMAANPNNPINFKDMFRFQRDITLLLPELAGLRLQNAEVQLKKMALSGLQIDLRHGNLITDSLTVSGPATAQLSQGSIYQFGSDTYRQITLDVQDSSQFNIANLREAAIRFRTKNGKVSSF